MSQSGREQIHGLVKLVLQSEVCEGEREVVCFFVEIIPKRKVCEREREVIYGFVEFGSNTRCVSDLERLSTG